MERSVASLTAGAFVAALGLGSALAESVSVGSWAPWALVLALVVTLLWTANGRWRELAEMMPRILYDAYGLPGRP
jgi:hypothetical protein